MYCRTTLFSRVKTNHERNMYSSFIALIIQSSLSLLLNFLFLSVKCSEICKRRFNLNKNKRAKNALSFYNVNFRASVTDLTDTDYTFISSFLEIKEDERAYWIKLKISLLKDKKGNYWSKSLRDSFSYRFCYFIFLF